MPAYYFDTSALAKRYVVEVGSAWVQALVTQQSGQTIYTSVLTQPEIVRGCPETFSHRCFEIKQPPCGNETQGHGRVRACSA